MKKERTNRQLVAYLPATTVLAELNRMVAEVSAVGIPPEATTMGGSFTDWSLELHAGQTAWLYSLERFHSITELVAYNEALAQRGVSVRSVKEPWFNDPTVSGSELLGHLFALGEEIHRRSLLTAPAVRRPAGVQGLARSVEDKAKRAVELRATRQMSVVAACRLAGCGVAAYYRYLKQGGRR